MRYFILFVFLLLGSSLYAQRVVKTEKASDYSVHIYGDKFEGVIFDKSHHEKFLDSYFDDKFRSRFTPTLSEISALEKLLFSNLKDVDQESKGRQAELVAKRLKRLFVSMLRFR